MGLIGGGIASLNQDCHNAFGDENRMSSAAVYSGSYAGGQNLSSIFFGQYLFIFWPTIYGQPFKDAKSSFSL